MPSRSTRRRWSARPQRKPREAHKKATAGLGEDAKLNKAAADVQKILADIKDGYSPFDIKEVALFVLNPDDLGAANSVVVIGFKHSMKPTEEARLLEQACADEDGFGTGMSEALGDLEGKFKTPSQAMATLVNTSPVTKSLPVARRQQLATLWAHWFSGEKNWGHCSLSATHRPSLGSWTGMPWEPMNFANKAVGRGIGKGVQYAMEWTPGLIFFRAMHPQLGIPEQPLWVLRTGDGDDEEAGAGASSSSSSKAAKAPKPSAPIPAPPSLESIKTFITQAQQVARQAKDKGKAKKATGSAKGASSAKAAPAKTKAAAPKKTGPKAGAVAKGRKGGK